MTQSPIVQRLAAVGIAALLATPAGAQTLRIAMTAADIPTTTGVPNNGFEGYRFMGYPPYDALVNWDFTQTDKPAEIKGGLFTEWRVDEKDPLRWLFTVRDGVVFHDGSAFNADAVVWNLQRLYDDKSPQYDPQGAAIVRAAVSVLDKWEKVDAHTVAISTKTPFSFFPYMLTRILMASPTQWEKVGKSWGEFAKQPSGTGPFKITKVVAAQQVEMERNDAYWDKARIPKVQKLVLRPMAEATTRLAALRSGQVDWIEVPPPDSIESLKAAGFQISLKPYPHTWPYVLRMTEGSPFQDKRVRQALNYALDREGIVKLIAGTARPAGGLYAPESPIFGNPTERYTYNPEKAKALLKEAGFGPDKPVKAKIMISTSGSGQMLPLPMNETIQQQVKPLGFDLEFDVVEWGAMLVAVRGGPASAQSHGVDGMNISLSWVDPATMFRYYHSSSYAPGNFNWGHWSTPKVDQLLNDALATFDPAQQTKLLAEAHSLIVDDAAWLFIVHDLNPRALSPKVKGFNPAQSWFQDLTQVTVQ
ncbi:MAG: ABC transporter substrate-binding protein [Proteobacteria bacterium]|nr:ABC transporter substrate-binding protein [Pseudomonadota bacterium]